MKERKSVVNVWLACHTGYQLKAGIQTSQPDSAEAGSPDREAAKPEERQSCQGGLQIIYSIYTWHDSSYIRLCNICRLT